MVICIDKVGKRKDPNTMEWCIHNNVSLARHKPKSTNIYLTIALLLVIQKCLYLCNTILVCGGYQHQGSKEAQGDDEGG